MRTRGAIIAAVLTAGCVPTGVALPGPEPTPGEAASASCASCSVSCLGVTQINGVLSAADGPTVFGVDDTEDGQAMVRIAADGTKATVAVASEPVIGFDVTQTAFVWWTGLNSGEQGVYTLDQGGGGPMVRAQLRPFVGVVADRANLYFVPAGATSLSAMPIGGGGTTTIATLPADATLVFVDDDAVYWEANRVGWRQLKDGSAVQPLGGPVSRTADPLNFYVHFATELAIVPRNGDPARTLVSWPSGFGHTYGGTTDVAVDELFVYYIDQACAHVNSGCALRRVPKAGGSSSTLCTSLAAPTNLLMTAGSLYVNDGGNIIRLDP